MRPQHLAADNQLIVAQRWKPLHASMRPQHLAADNLVATYEDVRRLKVLQ